MTTCLSIQLRTQSVVSIIIIETVPCHVIVLIADDRNIFYLQIKEYPFALLVLAINPDFSKTSSFLPFHTCFPSGLVVGDLMI